MIEVFKTNVKYKNQAKALVKQIMLKLDHAATFDLEDHDKILRVCNPSGSVQSSEVIHLLQSLGFHAEILPDLMPSISSASEQVPRPNTTVQSTFLS